MIIIKSDHFRKIPIPSPQSNKASEYFKCYIISLTDGFRITKPINVPVHFPNFLFLFMFPGTFYSLYFPGQNLHQLQRKLVFTYSISVSALPFSSSQERTHNTFWCQFKNTNSRKHYFTPALHDQLIQSWREEEALVFNWGNPTCFSIVCSSLQHF